MTDAVSPAPALPTSMRAAVLPAPGAALQVEVIPTPSPKRGEVLVRVAACGVCHTDLHVMRGEVSFPSPAVLGHEISGIVAGVGEDVDNVAVGDAVVSSFIMPCGSCFHCSRGEDDLCERFFAFNRLRGVLYDGTSRLARANGETLAMYSMGGFAEYCVVPATDVFLAPRGIPLTDSAILGCAVFTAYGALRNAGDVRPGESVAVVGTGGVGSMIVQVARAFGVPNIIAIDVTAEKLEAAKLLGATHTLDARDGDIAARVRALTAGRGVDVAVEAFGAPVTVASALDAVRDGGRVVLAGIAPMGVEASFEITRIVRRRIQLRGSFGGRARTDMPAVVALTEAGLVQPTAAISRRFTLDQAAEAFDVLGRGEIIGRAVVVMDGASAMADQAHS